MTHEHDAAVRLVELDLLDYFAAAAMQGDLANSAEGVLDDGANKWAGYTERWYDIAAAMLAEKAKREAAQEGGDK